MLIVLGEQDNYAYEMIKHPLSDAISRSNADLLNKNILKSFLFKDNFICLQWHPHKSYKSEAAEYYLRLFVSRSCNKKEDENRLKIVHKKNKPIHKVLLDQDEKAAVTRRKCRNCNSFIFIRNKKVRSIARCKSCNTPIILRTRK